MRRVVVTGLGLVSPLGNDPHALFPKLMSGQSAVRLVTVDGPKEQHFALAAQAKFDLAEHVAQVPKPDILDRVSQFSLAAAEMAIRDADVRLTPSNAARIGVSFGTGMGASKALEDSYAQLLLRDPNRVKPLTVLMVMNNGPAAHIAIHHGLRGPNLTYSCACASSTIAIGEAMRQIRHGYADIMIAGGAEALLTYCAMKSWEAMRVLAIADRDDPSASCRPFAKNRTGLVLGEGAAILVLEELESAQARGARIYAEVVGYGSSNDPGHITKPSVDGQAQAMQLALADAGANAEDVDYINAHGTATVLNDVTETRAIKQVFGDHAYRVPVSSTKSMLGHLLGGAGAVEFLISLLAIQHRAVPPTAHLDVPDPECDLDYVPGVGRRDQDIGCVMSNSFAFGGTNAVLVARRFEA